MLIDEEENMLKFGESLKYDEKDILGRGSYGAIVFSGLLVPDGNPKQNKVAVKRLQLSFIKSNSIEKFQNHFVRLSEEFKHPNVLHYLAIKMDSNFM